MKGSFRKEEARAALGFVLPALVLLLLFVYYPMGRAFLMSFQNYHLIATQSAVFVGLENYARLLSDATFLASFRHSLYFAAVVVPVQTAISLGLALLVQPRFRGVGLFRSAYFLPMMISFATASTVFRLMYNKDYGVLNVILKGIGLPALDFLSNPKVAMIGIIILGIWRAAGFYMVTFVAGLNNIPEALYEAAQLDGAGRLQRFRHVTLPLLKRTMAFVVIITTMDALKIFVPVYVTTNGGGPAGATRTVVLFIYETAFKQMHLGYAAAAAFVFFSFVLVISLIQMRLYRSDVEY